MVKRYLRFFSPSRIANVPLALSIRWRMANAVIIVGRVVVKVTFAVSRSCETPRQRGNAYFGVYERGRAAEQTYGASRSATSVSAQADIIKRRIRMRVL